MLTTLRQVKRSPGFRKGHLLADRRWTFWTLTAWDSQDSMRRYMTTGSHKRYGFPPQWLEFLIDESLLLPDPAARAEDGPDPKNIPFLALARVAGAWLVTGNLKHFPETIRNGVTVLSPTEYLAQLARD